MSAAIKSSLHKLNNAVYKLESALESKKLATKKPATASQNDLFSAGQQNPSNFNAVNVRMLATRLDTAINQVEQILKEGRG